MKKYTGMICFLIIVLYFPFSLSTEMRSHQIQTLESVKLQLNQCVTDYNDFKSHAQKKIAEYTANEDKMLDSVKSTILNLYSKNEKLSEFYNGEIKQLNDKLLKADNKLRESQEELIKVRGNFEKRELDFSEQIKLKDAVIQSYKLNSERIEEELRIERDKGNKSLTSLSEINAGLKSQLNKCKDEKEESNNKNAKMLLEINNSNSKVESHLQDILLRLKSSKEKHSQFASLSNSEYAFISTSIMKLKKSLESKSILDDTLKTNKRILQITEKNQAPLIKLNLKKREGTDSIGENEVSFLQKTFEKLGKIFTPIRFKQIDLDRNGSKLDTKTEVQSKSTVLLNEILEVLSDVETNTNKVEKDLSELAQTAKDIIGIIYLKINQGMVNSA